MRLLVLSDIHFASRAERERRGWEQRVIPNPGLRILAQVFRRFVWLAEPTAHNHRLEAFLQCAGDPDGVVANGDYSCDSAFVGVADDAAFASAHECLARLRARFGPRLQATLGDHELGKMSLFGGRGGPRLDSWHRATGALALEPFWTLAHGDYLLVGVTSSLAALPAFAPEILPDERDAWCTLREQHLADLRRFCGGVKGHQRLILFCHDPTALPYLAREGGIGNRMSQIALTIIGHLHSEAVLHASRWLAGIPELRFAGNTARRLSGALRRARDWAPFRVTLCPSLSGIQLLKDGGFLELLLPAEARHAPILRRHRLPWS